MHPMPKKKSTIPWASANKVAAKKSKPGIEKIDGIILGMQCMTTKGNPYSFVIADPHKTDRYLKKEQYLVLAKVFVNPVPKSSIKCKL